MLVASVAVGKAFTTQKEEMLVPEDIPSYPPTGYHSIVAEPGQGLNFDELVRTMPCARTMSCARTHAVASHSS